METIKNSVLANGFGVGAGVGGWRMFRAVALFCMTLSRCVHVLTHRSHENKSDFGCTLGTWGDDVST